MISTPHPASTAVATVTIVGRGRLGRATATALRAAGVEVFGPLGRSEHVPPSGVVLLCVPDTEIPAAATAVAVAENAAFVGHMSGATPVGGVVDFGLHPLQTFTGDEGLEAFHGIGCAVAGRTPAALEVAYELAGLLGARPFPLEDAQRAGYHAAASIASNFTVALLATAERVAATAGLAPDDARALLAPLVRTTVENWAVRGPEGALTGPVARGDERTVARQRDAIAAAAPESLALFDALVDRTRALAGRAAAAS